VIEITQMDVYNILSNKPIIAIIRKVTVPINQPAFRLYPTQWWLWQNFYNHIVVLKFLDVYILFGWLKNVDELDLSLRRWLLIV
jgi:hypothetical protein